MSDDPLAAMKARWSHIQEPFAEFLERKEFPVFHSEAVGQAGAGLTLATRRI
jgi:hypothetical protein